MRASTMLTELTVNLRWAWQHGTDELWAELDPELWALTHNPWVVLQTVSRGKLRDLLARPEYRTRGNNNPYNQDNETSWLDGRILDVHPDAFRFARLMIAFRKAHPSLCRSRFWREDIRWYGVGPQVDLSHAARSLAFCLRGASQGDDDVDVMVNAYWETLDFSVQDGVPAEWRRVVDTGRESPDDIREPGQEVLQTSARYTVGPRSVVVLVRPRRS